MIQQSVSRASMAALAWSLCLMMSASADTGVPLDGGAAASTNGSDVTFEVAGEVFHRAQVTTNPAGLKIRHSKGVCTIDYMDMTESERALHGYDQVGYLAQKSIDQEQSKRSEATQRLWAEDVRVQQESERGAITVEVDLLERKGDCVIVRGTRVVGITKIVDAEHMVRRLKGPGMVAKDEKTVVKRTVPVEEHRPLPSELAVVDVSGQLIIGNRWSGVLYPTGMSYEGRPEYVTRLEAVPQMRRRLHQEPSPDSPPALPMSAWMAMGKGAMHGFTLPLRLGWIEGLALLEPEERTFVYWSGVVVGCCGFLAVLITLFSKRAK